MEDQGKKQTALKCPAALQHILGRGTGYLTIEDGMAIRQWVDGGAAVDPNLEAIRNLLIEAAEDSVEALRQVWSDQGGKMQRALGGAEYIATLRASAEAYEQAHKEADQKEEGGE
jgi:hypothetical protein